MIGVWQLVIIFVIILVLFGAGKIPVIMKDLGTGLRAFKKGLEEDEDFDGEIDATSIKSEQLKVKQKKNKATKSKKIVVKLKKDKKSNNLSSSVNDSVKVGSKSEKKKKTKTIEKDNGESDLKKVNVKKSTQKKQNKK